MLFGNHGLNKPICFGLVIFSLTICLCIISFQNISSNPKGLTIHPALDMFSVVRNRIEHFRSSNVEKNVEKQLNVESKHSWRHFWTVFFANKTAR